MRDTPDLVIEMVGGPYDGRLLPITLSVPADTFMESMQQTGSPVHVRDDGTLYVEWADL